MLNHLFFSLFKTFNFFFSQLEDSFKFKIALNLMSKIIEKKEVIISENQNSIKNKFKYIYFIGKGVLNVSKNNIDICRFDSGSYFGDEYFLTNSAKFTYSNANDEDMILFCCPISIINELCHYYEEDFTMLLIKTLIRFSKIRLIAEKKKIIFNDKNDEFFKKIIQQKFKNNKGKNLTQKQIIFTEESKKNEDINIEIIKINQNIELKSVDEQLDKEINNDPNTYKNNISSEDHKGKAQQIFSKDDISRELDENNIFGEITIEKNWGENQDLNRNISKNDEQEEEEDIFDNLDFLDKIEINEENFGDMVRLQNRKDKFKIYNQYLEKLVKKLNFINYQVEFIRTHYGSIKTKSKKVIDAFESHDNKFFK